MASEASRPLLFGRNRSSADHDEGLGRRGERPVAFGYEHEGPHKGEPPNLERDHCRLRLYRARRDDADARARSDSARDRRVGPELHRYSRRDPGGRQRIFHGLARRRTLFPQHERSFGKIPRFYLIPGERVAGGDHHDQLVTSDGDADEPGIVYLAAYDGHLKGAPQQGIYRLVGVGDVYVEGHVWVTGREFYGQPREQQLPRRGRCPDEQSPLGRDVTGHDCLKSVDLFQDPPRVLSKALSRWRGLGIATSPNEQHYSEALLQSAQVVRYSRLRHPQLPPGRRERAVLQHGEEDAYALDAKPHRGNLSREGYGINQALKSVTD